MFRNFYTEGRLSDSQSSPSSAPLGVASVGFDSQESSWIGLLSRPALSLLRKVRRWSAAPAEISNSFIGEEREILRQLNEIMPPAAHHLSYTQCHHDGTAGLLEPGPAGSVPWLTAVSVPHVGLQSPGEVELHQQPQLGYFSSVRTLINQVLVNSQEVQSWVSVSPPGRSGSAGEAGPWWGSFLRGGHISEISGEGAETHIPPSVAQTKTPPVLEAMLPESSGPPQLANSGVQNMERPSAEQDNGYSSLEEELSQRGLLSRLSPPSEEQNQQEPPPQMDEVPEAEEELSAPQCRNKTIAFIMGCPCSDDDDSSQSESGDDDDGFDSEGSSDLSDSSDEDEDDEASDSEPDLESERLWTSLCQSVDPYNPRSFAAPLRTAAPPPSAMDAWDDSTSASEAEEAESLLLLSSFSCSSDPYSPLNFKAPLRTRGPAGPPSRTRSRTGPAAQTVHQNPAAPPEYRKEEAEERLDSGFAEASARSSKKVRFCDDVEEFFASCGEEEDRRGPWEELARDRCRFLRRCQEVEQSIGFCLQPQHRRRVFQRLSTLARS